MGFKDFAGNVMNTAQDLNNKAQNLENKATSAISHVNEAPEKFITNKTNEWDDKLKNLGLDYGSARTPLQVAFDNLYKDEQAMVMNMDANAMRAAYKANKSSARLMKYYELYIQKADAEEKEAAERIEAKRKSDLAKKYKAEAFGSVKNRLYLIKSDILKEMNEALSSAGYSTYAEDSSVAVDFLEKSNDTSKLEFDSYVAKSDEVPDNTKEKLISSQIDYIIKCEAEKACYDAIVMFVYKNDKGNAAEDKIVRVKEFSNNSFCKKYKINFDSKMHVIQKDYYEAKKPKFDFIHLKNYKNSLVALKKDPLLADWDFYEINKQINKAEKLMKFRKTCLIVVGIALVILLFNGFVAIVNKTNSNKTEKAIARKQLAREKYIENMDKEPASKTTTGKSSSFNVKNVEFGGKLKDVLAVSKDGANITVNDDMSISYAIGIEYKKELLIFLANKISVNGLDFMATPGLLGVEEYNKSDFSKLYKTIENQLGSHWQGETIVLEFTVENPELFGGAINPVLRTEKERKDFVAKMANKKKLVISAE